MDREHYTASDMDRLLIIKELQTRQITQAEAAQWLGLSVRQVKRLLKRFRTEGPVGIKKRHKGLNRRFKAHFKQEIMGKVCRLYADFGPTFAAEKLHEAHGLTVNHETLRQWMIEAGLWQGRIRKQARIHQSRERRPRFGELVQIDGSQHDWFEGRAPKCCLLVFIDDATSEIVGLLFTPSETSLAYLQLMEQHLGKYGRPLAYYSDKHSIFRTTREAALDGYIKDTQVHRALKEFKIELICAHSSQAKGRVERANKTLQDRLIKELRLRGISTIEEANSYLPEFRGKYNKKFGKKPAHPEDAHRPLYHDKEAVQRILSLHEHRKLSKNLEFSFKGKTFQIITKTTGYRLRHKQVTICQFSDASLGVFADNTPLDYKVLDTPYRRPAIDFKELNLTIDGILTAKNCTNNEQPNQEQKCSTNLHAA